MEHSARHYLERQATPLLRQLLRRYESQAEDDYYAFLACVIRTILFLRGEENI